MISLFNQGSDLTPGKYCVSNMKQLNVYIWQSESMEWSGPRKVGRKVEAENRQKSRVTGRERERESQGLNEPCVTQWGSCRNGERRPLPSLSYSVTEQDTLEYGIITTRCLRDDLVNSQIHLWNSILTNSIPVKASLVTLYRLLRYFSAKLRHHYCKGCQISFFLVFPTPALAKTFSHSHLRGNWCHNLTNNLIVWKIAWITHIRFLKGGRRVTLISYIISLMDERRKWHWKWQAGVTKSWTQVFTSGYLLLLIFPPILAYPWNIQATYHRTWPDSKEMTLRSAQE